jgi:hypothetical protein
MGGLFAVRHYACRAILWLSGQGPWHYGRFLDSAADRLLLRKVGSGFIFVHRTVLEHFASRAESAPKSVAPQMT